jgi:hypothetical protein
MEGDKGEGDFVNAPLSLTLSHEGRGDFLLDIIIQQDGRRMITSV